MLSSKYTFQRLLVAACLLGVGIVSYLLWDGEPLEQRIDRAERQWHMQGITDYHLKLRTNSSYIIATIELTVHDNQVVDYRCSEAEGQECNRAQPDWYTIPRLFALARSNPIDGTSVPTSQSTKVRFDRTYSFPNHITIDCPKMFDEEVDLSVQEFDVLK